MSSIGGFKLINEPVTIMVAHPKPSETEDSTSSEDPAWLDEISGEDSISTEDSISGEQARQREINFYRKVGDRLPCGIVPKVHGFWQTEGGEMVMVQERLGVRLGWDDLDPIPRWVNPVGLCDVH